LEDKKVRRHGERRRERFFVRAFETFETTTLRRKERTNKGVLTHREQKSSVLRDHDVIDSRGGFLVPNDQERRGGRPRSDRREINFRRVSASVLFLAGEKEKQENERF